MLGGQSNFGPIGPDQFANQGGFDLNLFDLGITDASAVQAFPQRFATSLRREFRFQQTQHTEFRLL